MLANWNEKTKSDLDTPNQRCALRSDQYQSPTPSWNPFHVVASITGSSRNCNIEPRRVRSPRRESGPSISLKGPLLPNSESSGRMGSSLLRRWNYVARIEMQSHILFSWFWQTTVKHGNIASCDHKKQGCGGESLDRFEERKILKIDRRRRSWRDLREQETYSLSTRTQRELSLMEMMWIRICEFK